MRHTRNRQMKKVRKGWNWDFNVPIKGNAPFLDKSFEWHRDWYYFKGLNILTWENKNSPLGKSYHHSKGEGIF